MKFLSFFSRYFVFLVYIVFAFITFGDILFIFQGNKVSLKQAPGHNHETRYFKHCPFCRGHAFWITWSEQMHDRPGKNRHLNSVNVLGNVCFLIIISLFCLFSDPDFFLKTCPFITFASLSFVRMKLISLCQKPEIIVLLMGWFIKTEMPIL